MSKPTAKKASLKVTIDTAKALAASNPEYAIAAIKETLKLKEALAQSYNDKFEELFRQYESSTGEEKHKVLERINANRLHYSKAIAAVTGLNKILNDTIKELSSREDESTTGQKGM